MANQLLLSILSIYNFTDGHVFDGFALPDNVPTDLRDVCITDIISRLAELDVSYSDPDTLREMICVWSKRMQYTWRTLYATTVLVYDPIYNYDRFEEWSDSSSSQSDRDASTSTSGNGEAVDSVVGFDSETFKNAAKSNTSSTANGTTIDRSTDTTTSTHTARLYGNIGVTTSQQMVTSEREVAEFDFVAKVTESFKQNFCLMVY